MRYNNTEFNKGYKAGFLYWFESCLGFDNYDFSGYSEDYKSGFSWGYLGGEYSEIED